jgi:hypothetical protein
MRSWLKPTSRLATAARIEVDNRREWRGLAKGVERLLMALSDSRVLPIRS